MNLTAEHIARLDLRVDEKVEALIDLTPGTSTPQVGAIIDAERGRYCVRLVLRRGGEGLGARVVGVLLD